MAVMVIAFSITGCGAETAEVVDSKDTQQQVTYAKQMAATAQAELNDARQQAKLLAEKIATLVGERDKLKQERDDLRSQVMQAGEKFAAVQTQFSELRARSAEVNDAIQSLDKLISGTANDTGIAINPRDNDDTNNSTSGPMIAPAAPMLPVQTSNDVYTKPAPSTADTDE